MRARRRCQAGAERGQVGRRLGLRLTPVVPRAQPLKVGARMVVTVDDVVALSASSLAPTAVTQHGLAPATSTSADELTTPIPVTRKTPSTITPPRHDLTAPPFPYTGLEPATVQIYELTPSRLTSTRPSRAGHEAPHGRRWPRANATGTAQHASSAPCASTEHPAPRSGRVPHKGRGARSERGRVHQRGGGVVPQPPPGEDTHPLGVNHPPGVRGPPGDGHSTPTGRNAISTRRLLSSAATQTRRTGLLRRPQAASRARTSSKATHTPSSVL